MNSNSGRTKQQLATIPVALAVISAALWPISWVAAQYTGWVSVPTSTFMDVWCMALTIVTFIGAGATTIACVICSLDAAWEWVRE